jgi:hypothetical protein
MSGLASPQGRACLLMLVAVGSAKAARQWEGMFVFRDKHALCETPTHHDRGRNQRFKKEIQSSAVPIRGPQMACKRWWQLCACGEVRNAPQSVTRSV